MIFVDFFLVSFLKYMQYMLDMDRAKKFVLGLEKNCKSSDSCSNNCRSIDSQVVRELRGFYVSIVGSGDFEVAMSNYMVALRGELSKSHPCWYEKRGADRLRKMQDSLIPKPIIDYDL